MDEPSPALRYRLTPPDKVAGNAAIYYLKAMGFLEERSAQAAVAKLEQQWIEQARTDKKKGYKPKEWLSSDPTEIDLELAHQYLDLHRFQVRELRQAAVRKSFDLDRRIADVDDPISYLLPEIQTLRQLSRIQSLRTRVALAENRIDGAIECLQQQFAMAGHLGEEPFLVSTLVGIAIGRIATNDTLYLMQQENAPNLYWAIVAMPKPLVDLTSAMEFERSVLFQQLKPLKEVNEHPHPPEYWNDFLDRMAPQFGYFASELGLSNDTNDPRAVRQGLVGYVMAGYPGAKRFLMEELGKTNQELEKYTPTQVVMLATVRYYEVARDHLFRYLHLPYWQVSSLAQGSIEKRFQRDAKRYGWITRPAELLLPAITAVQEAQARSTQSLAALQTIEAIRIYATRGNNGLPPSLDELPLPPGIDPVTGKRPQYATNGDTALLTTGAISGVQYQYRLSIAADPKN